jgi:Ca2+-binding RTX toxin-like protein
VKVTDNLPVGVNLVQGPSGGGFSCGTHATSPEITCSKASQPVGTATITYKATISNAAQPGQKFTNTATLSTNPFDPVASNNTSSHTVSVPGCTRSGAGVIQGTQGNDVICGSAGADAINALGGNDLVFGRGGNDAIQGASGNDTLFGEAGDDLLQGGDGTDKADGGSGADSCVAEVKISC